MDLKNGYTIGILGAGTMGTAVVNSTLNAVARGNGFDVRVPLPGRFLAAVSSEKSAARLREAYGSKIEVIVGDNNRLVRESDIVVLGMKPFMAQSILSKVDTCSNKTVISLLAGKTIEQLRELTDNSNIIARAMTNTPSKVSKTSDFKSPFDHY
jgi:pyrroline-5-carboxylate reductase